MLSAKRAFLAVVLLPWGATWALAEQVEAPKREITIRDSVEFANFDRQMYGFDREDPLIASPNRRKAVFSTTRGDVATNKLVGSLYLVEDLAAARPSVRKLAEFASDSSERPLSSLQWVGNDRLVFRAQAGNDQAQAYAFELTSSELVKLSDDSAGVAGVRASKDGSTIVYLPYPDLPDCRRALLSKSGVVSPSDSAWSLALCHVINPPGAGIPVANMGVLRHGKSQRVTLPVPSNLTAATFGILYISPNGRYIAIQSRLGPDEVPASWKQLPWTMTQYPIYTLYDVETGTFQRLVDAPNYVTSVSWSSDSSTAFVSSYVPADITGGKPAANPIRHLLAVDMRSGQVNTLAAGDFEYCYTTEKQEMHFRPNMGRRSPRASEIEVQKTARGWSVSKAKLAQSCEGKTSSLSIRESVDDPPELISSTSEIIFDPNPGLALIRLGHVAPLEWKDVKGNSFAGRIFYPPAYDPSHRYPLVIQTHWEQRNPNFFTLDGESAAGYAGQYLASHGVLVVQVPDVVRSLREENKDNLEMIEGIVNMLSIQSHVDTTRMAIQAWSRTGMHVRYLLLHSRYKFVAAAFVDSMRMSYLQWVLGQNANGGLEQQMFEQFYGVAPVGDGLRAWIPDSLEMSLNHVSTAIREMVFQPEEVIVCMEAYAAAKHLHKPYELVYLPEASHDPVRPSDRLEVQGGTADWFLYWLLGYRDPSLTKREQYSRWDAMQIATAGHT